MSPVVLSALAGVAFAACETRRARPPEAASPDVAEIAAAIDASVSPCEDFYRHACGGWLARHEIPADRSFTSRLVALDDRTHALVREVLEAAAASPGADPRRRRIGELYAGCMDLAAIDAAGATPLAPALADIAAVRDVQTAFEAAARLRGFGVAALLTIDVDADFREPRVNLLDVRQGGLGLPGRELYLDASGAGLLAGYSEHVAAMLALVEPADAALAGEVVALETTLARASLPLEQLREVEATYHPLDVAALAGQAPGLEWSRVLAAAGNPAVRRVNLATPGFFQAVIPALAQTRPEVLRAYLRWQLIHATADHLAGPIEGRAFAWTATLTGQRAQQPRWRRCVERTVALLPESVGPDYVALAFGGDARATAQAMIVAIEQAFERGLAGLAWMDAATQQRARAKAAAIRNKIGFPDRWRDDAAVTIDRRDYFAGVVAATRAEALRTLAKADQAVDPEEWFMPVSELNAYANPQQHEMVFPAAILQPPLFSAGLPMAVNFGAIGSIMGHELTHHFDDQGRKFDETGAMKEWWSEASRAGFEAAARCVADQYDAFSLGPGLAVNGRQTLGENIADLGGLELAHAAFVRWTAERPETSPIAGLSAEQLFFVAYAQNFCGKLSPELERVRLLSDEHAPRQLRVNGPLMHTPAFWAAFKCAEGTPMHPAKVCSVW